MNITRSMAASMGQEAVNISLAGKYADDSQAEHDIANDLRKAVDGTITFGPGDAAPSGNPPQGETVIWASNESTLSAAKRLTDKGFHVAALNFASAKRPGGGFLSGALAQEESLCRSSALYSCIQNSPMYTVGRPHDNMYESWVIWSPKVPVFRDDAGRLCQPWKCSFLTCAAPNLSAGPADPSVLDSVLRERAKKILDVAAAHGPDALVLGAWGCGVFRNDPDQVSGIFRSLLEGRFHGQFREVAFAVLDDRPGQPVLAPFVNKFGRAV